MAMTLEPPLVGRSRVAPARALLQLLLAAGCSTSQATEVDVAVLLQTTIQLRRWSPLVGFGANATLSADAAPEGIILDPFETAMDQDPARSVAAIRGIEENAEGDLSALLSSLALYGGGAVVFVCAFMILRTWYPLIYSNNVLLGIAPCVPPEGMLGWLRATLGTTTEQAADSIGLDNAMLLEFCNLCMKISAIIGVPMLGIMGPLHGWCGGHRAAKDRLSYTSMGNVEFGSWLYWVHAFVVWAVVITVHVHIFWAQEKFVKLRYKWLREQPEPRCTTILVEGIPWEYQSNKQLELFFKEMFGPSQVKSAYVVKDTGSLSALVKRFTDEQRDLQYADDASVHEKRAKLEKTRSEWLAMKHQILTAAEQIGGVNSSNGFVTFHDRRHARQAKMLIYTSDFEEWVVSTPPAPESVNWSGLNRHHRIILAQTLTGYALVASLYVLYTPAVVGITNLATEIHLGLAQPLWASFAPTLGLEIVVAFLPTFLMLIFRYFFYLNDNRWTQHSVQNWYFIFQVVFIILVTAIGSNIVHTSKVFVDRPTELFGLLADTMPMSTHYYLTFMVLQVFVHALNLTRYFPLIKFWLAKRIYDDEDARQLAEPEDQDFYGTGSRSARFTINMLIGIIFGTLSPPMSAFVFVNFAACRVVYGYLLCFAETKKPDLGGVFFAHQLRHLFLGSVIYITLMTGVLYRRARNSGPAVISGICLLYVAISFYRFMTAFRWWELPYVEVVAGESVKAGRSEMQYVQTELLDDALDRCGQ